MSRFLAEKFYDFLRDLREYGLEYTSSRYYGDYVGLVTNDKDPQGQGRVRVSCGIVRGIEDEIGLWAYPVTPYAGPDRGMFFPPEKDDAAWVSFDQGLASQPRVSGSWWRNKHAERKPETSEVPKEFAYVDLKPQRRGIKTKKGILLFDDAAPKVRLATIDQTEVGVAADVKHKIELDSTKGEEQVIVASFAGHTSSWIDVAGKEALEHKSAKGHFFKIDDVKGSLTISTDDGHKIVIDKLGKKITVTTLGQQKIELSDLPIPSILLQDVTGNIIKTDPVAGVSITTPLNVAVTAAAAATVNAGLGATVVAAGGPLAMTGQGTVLTSAGGGPAIQSATGVSLGSFTGLKTDTYLGGLIQAVVGLWAVTSTLVQIVSPSVQIGAIGPKFGLVDLRFFTNPTFGYPVHTHPTTVPGVPTGPPIQTVIPAAVTTQAVTAN